MDRGAFRALREGCRNRGRKENDMAHSRQLTPAEKLIQRLMMRRIDHKPATIEPIQKTPALYRNKM